MPFFNMEWPGRIVFLRSVRRDLSLVSHIYMKNMREVSFEDLARLSILSAAAILPPALAMAQAHLKRHPNCSKSVSKLSDARSVELNSIAMPY
jgi:uncharacterized protein with von Willebrand factor type A (vWA) domain